jgi:anti-sigma factor RsiW
MTDCAKIQRLLPLSAGGDLDARRAEALRAHLAGCPYCIAELAEYTQVVSLAQAIGSADERLPAGVRRRIAAQAAGAAGDRFWVERIFALAWLIPIRAPGLTAATVAAALVALVAVPMAVRNGSDVPPAAVAEQVTASPDKIEMTFQDGVVRLAWNDGREDGYIISKSSDPRGLAGVEKHRVSGNAWVDRDPETSRIVYYRIE